MLFGLKFVIYSNSVQILVEQECEASEAFVKSLPTDFFHLVIYMFLPKVDSCLIIFFIWFSL